MKKIFIFFRRYEKKVKIYTYCDKCKGFSTYKEISIKNYDRVFSSLDYEHNKIICPNCGKIYTQRRTIQILRWYGGLTYFGNIDKYSIKVKIKDMGKKIYIVYYHRILSPLINGIKTEYAISTLIINIENGNSYLINPKVRKNPIEGDDKLTIWNISYFRGLKQIKKDMIKLTKKQLKLVYNLLYQKLRSVCDFKLLSFEEMGTPLTLKNLILFNRMPEVPPQLYKNLIESSFLNDRLLRKLKRNRDFILEIEYRLNVKLTKKIRKYIIYDLYYNCGKKFFILLRYIKIIKDTSNLIKITEKVYSSFIKGYPYENTYLEGTFLIKEKKMLRALIKEFGETISVNKIQSCNDAGIYIDTINMYYLLSNMENLNLNLSGSISKIHDRFLEINLNLVSVPLKYKDKIYILEDIIDGYKFQLPRNTNELQIVGDKMHICVASYSETVIMHNTIIVYVTIDAKFTLCIQINKNCKKVLQAKSYCNYLPKGKLLDVLLKWIKKKDLIIATKDILV